MFQYLGYIAAVIIGAMLYAFGYELVKSAFDYVKERGVSFGKKINLSGIWYAVWQTTVEGNQNINTEILRLRQKGNRIVIENIEKSPENKLGGYLWRAEAKIYDNEHIIGHYLPIEKNVISKGALYFVLNRSGDFMVGKWTGCNYDYDLTWGFGVIAKDKEFAIRRMKRLLNVTDGIKNSSLNGKGR